MLARGLRPVLNGFKTQLGPGRCRFSHGNWAPSWVAKHLRCLHGRFALLEGLSFPELLEQKEALRRAWLEAGLMLGRASRPVEMLRAVLVPASSTWCTCYL